jgi:hypothetical protein
MLKRFPIKAGAGSIRNEQMAFRIVRRTTQFGIHHKTPFQEEQYIKKKESLRSGWLHCCRFTSIDVLDLQSRDTECMVRRLAGWEAAFRADSKVRWEYT